MLQKDNKQVQHKINRNVFFHKNIIHIAQALLPHSFCGFVLIVVVQLWRAQHGFREDSKETKRFHKE